MTSTLVTGGAGFVGGHLVDALLDAGHDVRILDNLDPQAHEGGVAANANPSAEFINGDLRDAEAVGRALDGVEYVFHQGGMVGNGQSMYEIRRYVDVNSVGTAVLLEQILERRDTVRRLITASSMVVYGEGAYECAEHGKVAPPPRRDEALSRGDWEPVCPVCASAVTAVATPETQALVPTSTYAISKRDAEELTLITGRAHGLETVALRYLNVYGPRQALSNPYTGVAAIFCTRLLGGNAPIIFEDGKQRRDLVHVSDVVAANIAAMTAPRAPGNAINIGTGKSITITEIATMLADSLGVEIQPEIGGRFRAGDIRHCWADVTRARELLGWSAERDRKAAFHELAEWVSSQAPTDHTEEAHAALAARGLLR